MQYIRDIWSTLSSFLHGSICKACTVVYPDLFLSCSTVVTVLGIMEVWSFQPKNITQKPTSRFLFNSLAALIRHSQAQKCLQINPKPFQQVVMKFPS